MKGSSNFSYKKLITFSVILTLVPYLIIPSITQPILHKNVVTFNFGKEETYVYTFSNVPYS